MEAYKQESTPVDISLTASTVSKHSGQDLSTSVDISLTASTKNENK